MEKAYKVKKNLYDLNIECIEIESRTDKFYKAVGSHFKDSFATNYHAVFLKESEAVDYIESLINIEVSSAKSRLDHAYKIMNEFKIKYNR